MFCGLLSFLVFNYLLSIYSVIGFEVGVEFRPNASCFDQTAGSVSNQAKPALRRAGREQGSMLPGLEPLEYAQLGGYQAVCVFYHR